MLNKVLKICEKRYLLMMQKLIKTSKKTKKKTVAVSCKRSGIVLSFKFYKKYLSSKHEIQCKKGMCMYIYIYIYIYIHVVLIVILLNSIGFF